MLNLEAKPETEVYNIAAMNTSLQTQIMYVQNSNRPLNSSLGQQIALQSQTSRNEQPQRAGTLSVRAS